MQARFLLGPAGSGKTFRCLTEIREALLASPEGPPLVFLAPKQATFQLERQLLADPALPGYTRLQILSFERLAEFVFEKLNQPQPKLLAEEGRVMVLRALLGQKKNELHLFRASARLPGFAGQLSQLLRELQRYHLTPAKLESLAAKVGEGTASLFENAFKSGRAEFGVPPSGGLDERPPEGGTPNQSFPSGSKLDAKLRDLALLLRAYHDWLKQHNLEDADGLLDLTAAALRSESSVRHPPPTSFRLGGLWLDGFAQMTPQERQLLAAVIQCADQATLAFCLEEEPVDNAPWHSPWSLVGETCLRCREELALWPDVEIKVELLRRAPELGRFAASPPLQHLEQHWTQPKPFSEPGMNEVRVVECTDPESEAVFAARAILRHVREENGRFRDAAILLRSLEGHHDVIRRVFARYEIPYFLDRRESVAHHPLAELTRYALRTVAFDWKQDDWFGALKTGLVPASEDEIDRLENEALAHGWEGKFWRQPPALGGTGDPPVPSGDSPDGMASASATHSDARFPAATSPIPVGESPTGADGSPVPPISRTGSGDSSAGKPFERLWLRIVPPFAQLASSLATARHEPNGTQLAAALRKLWDELKIKNRLDEWSSMDEANVAFRTPRSVLHQTVWEQMNEWLRNLEIAFANEPLPLSDWLPIVESGLGNLSVGVIPPALDQVLVGTIDRSRNPDLQLALVLGVNEGVFPAPPVPPTLLNSSDRAALASQDAALGPDHRQQIGLERYYGYIACTRARRHLVLTYAKRDTEERTLNPSPFIDQVRRLFPQLTLETFSASSASQWDEARHRSELVAPLLKLRAQSAQLTDWTKRLVESVPSLQPVLAKWEQMAASRPVGTLASELAGKIYGAELHTSVSALEDFASCPFKFFAARGLRAEERIEFQVDQREKGTFQHEVLREFHRQVRAAGKRWRDLSGPEARQWIRQIGEELLPAYRDGLFLANPSRRFAARLLMEGLEKLVETLIGWAPQYQFDPQAVEVSFGLRGSRLPAWRIDLDGKHALLLRGRVDRVDLCRIEETGEALGVIIDYKSSARELDPVLLHHGLELQLLAYLGALTQSEGLEEELKVSRLLPAGVFYVSLKGGGGSAGTRDAERLDREPARRAGYQHRGRFDGDRLSQFDQRGQAKGDQFRYSKNKNGAFGKRGNEALPGKEFQELLAQVKEFLKQFGRGIYAGQVEVAPYRWKQATACDFCAYRPVCRFDPWTQPYRVLRPPPKANPPTDPGAAGTATKGAPVS